jgi:DNA-binding protein H-NS
MANIKTMDVEGLLSLRAQIDKQLATKRAELHRMLESLGEGNGFAGNGRRKAKGRSLKGRKVPPKYRSKKDSSLTWAGRGATPVWMRDEMKASKLKKDAFLIK